jgi:regulator of replication initiation timing
MKKEIKKEETPVEEKVETPVAGVKGIKSVIEDNVVEKTAVEIALEDIKAKLEEKDKQIEMLMSIADEGRKDRFASKTKGKITPRVKVTKLNGKVVVGSRTLIDEVYKDLSDKGNWVEKQIYCYTLEDGTTIDLPLPQFNRIYEKVEADVMKIAEVPEKESENGDKHYRYTVKMLEDGREIELDYQYVN